MFDFSDEKKTLCACIRNHNKTAFEKFQSLRIQVLESKARREKMDSNFFSDSMFFVLCEGEGEGG